MSCIEFVRVDACFLGREGNALLGLAQRVWCEYIISMSLVCFQWVRTTSDVDSHLHGFLLHFSSLPALFNSPCVLYSFYEEGTLKKEESVLDWMHEWRTTSSGLDRNPPLSLDG